MSLAHKWAPAPWQYVTSGKPGGNGDLNVYVQDANGRKIAAVWGKRGEKEATACLLVSAPELYAELAEIVRKWGFPNTEEWHRANNALKKARGEQ